MLTGLFRREDGVSKTAGTLYEGLVAQSRAPRFYADLLVPDTIDGRFDLLALHGFLVLDGLSRAGEQGNRIGTALATRIFAGLEDALRDLGVGDIGLSRRMKQMADAFYGRISVYGAAQDEDAMAAALLRNLYRGEDARTLEARRLAPYVLSMRAKWRENPAPLLNGAVHFDPVP